MIFNSIHVDNFRGIKTAEIDDFRRINVFFGKNNCGKSTLLEALFLISGQSNPLLPFSINSLRGYNRLQEDDLGWVFHNMNTTNPVHIATDGDTPRHMDITAFRKTDATIDLSNPDTLQDSAPVYYGYAIDFDGGLHSEVALEKTNLANTKINTSPVYTENISVIYANPRVPMIDQFVEVLKVMVTNKSTDFLVRVLRKVEPKLQSVSLVGNIVMVDLGGDKLLPIQMMGDGVLRMLSIVLNMYKCSNGMLIIDELDNGLHYSVMPNLWNALFAAADACNVQLFVSTHNIDSLRALAGIIDVQDAQDKAKLSAYKLVRSEDDVVQGIRYDADTLHYMINQEIEVR